MELVSSDFRELLTGLAATVAHSAGRLALVLIAGFILARVLRTLLVQLERVLVITAHPDDVDFGASGTIAGWVAEGVQVVTQHPVGAGDRR